MSGDFYVVLPSNTKTDIFQDNKTGDYEISLPRAMEFGGATYEVALCEIHFPHTWLNIIKAPNAWRDFYCLGK